MAAYEELVRAHQTVAFRTAFTISGDAAEAEDATQEAFVKVFRTLDRFKTGSPFRPWLLTVVANEARNRRRAAGRRLGLTIRVAEQGPQAASSSSPEATVVAGERRAELLGAVDELRQEDREVISLRYFLELSEAEAASNGTTFGEEKGLEVALCGGTTPLSRAETALATLGLDGAPGGERLPDTSGIRPFGRSTGTLFLSGAAPVLAAASVWLAGGVRARR